MRTLLAAGLVLALGTSCMKQSTIRQSWWGEEREGGAQAVVLGYQASSGVYEPFLSVEVDPAWRGAPRERLEGTADWTLLHVQPGNVRRDTEVSTGVHSSEIYVSHGPPSDGYAEAHRNRGEGKSVYLVRAETTGTRTHATLFGGDGWPMDWVRIAEFAWDEPAPHWGLSDATQEMFSSFANAAAFSTFCVR